MAAEQTTVAAEPLTPEMNLVQTFRAFKKQRDNATASALRTAIDTYLATAYEDELKKLQARFGK